MSEDGIRKSAILLMSIGEDEAVEVFKYLSPREVQKLGAAMAELQNVEREQVEAALQERLGATLLAPVRQRFDETEIRVSIADAIPTLRALHDEPNFAFEMLIDLCGVDTGEEMQIVYHLSSSTTGDWLRVIVPGVDRSAPRVNSLVSLWPGAEWMEREAYDMFGIIFEGNRDLRRIYMPDDYLSHPLRKDFYLADDASRSPAAGVRNMERAGTPADATRATALRKSSGA